MDQDEKSGPDHTETRGQRVPVKGNRVVELTEALNDRDVFQRLQAACTLVEAGEGALDPLILALRHDTDEVRWRAAVALGWIGHSGAVDALVAALEGAPYEVKINAVWALGQIADGRALNALQAIVHAPGDKEPDIRYVAALALARFGALDTLKADLRSEHDAAFRVAHAAIASTET